MTGTAVNQIIVIAIMVIAFIPAIVVHEVAHGFAAYKLGDPTAKHAGRLSLNPIKHVDPFGTVLLPAILIATSALSGGGGMVFGYAKPVPYNPRYFKNIRTGEVIVGLAGPASNFIMALIGAVIAWGAFIAVGSTSLGLLRSNLFLYLWYFGTYFCEINLALAFFNLIPLPPLDGSSIIAPLLSDKALQTYYRIQQYAMFILILVIIVLPYMLHIDIVGWYLNITAGNIAGLLLPF